MIVGRYEEAIDWADQALGEEPSYRPAMRIKVIANAYLGRIEEARDWLRRLLEVEPGLTVAGFKAYAATYFPPEILDVWVDGFRKAGVPEG